MAKKEFELNKKKGLQLLNEKIANLNDNTPSFAKEEGNELYELMRELGYEFVDYELIDPNPDNGFPINNMTMTTYTIEEYGIFHNLVLSKENGRYKIISGERRYLAIGQSRKKCIEENKPIPVEFQKILAKIIDATTLDQKIVLRLANLDTRNMNNVTKRKQVYELSHLLMQKNKLAKTKKEKVNIANMIAEALKVEKRQIFKYQKINRFLIEELIDLLDKEELKIDLAEKIASYPIEYQYQIWDIYKDNHSMDIQLIKPNKEKQKKLVERKLEEKRLELKTFNEKHSEQNVSLTEDEILFIEMQANDIEKQIEALEWALERVNEEKATKSKIETQNNTKLLGRIANTYKKVIQNVDKFEETLNKNTFEPEDKKKIVEELDKAIEKLQHQKDLLKS